MTGPDAEAARDLAHVGNRHLHSRCLLIGALAAALVSGCQDSAVRDDSRKAGGGGGVPLNQAYASEERRVGFPIAIDPRDPRGCRVTTHARWVGRDLFEVEEHFGRCSRVAGGVRFEAASGAETFAFREHGPYLTYADGGESITLVRLVPCPAEAGRLCNPDTLPFGKGGTPGASLQPGLWEASQQPVYAAVPGAPPPPPPPPPNRYCITPGQARSPDAFWGSRGLYWSRDDFTMREGRVYLDDPTRGHLEGSFTATTYEVSVRGSNGITSTITARRIGDCRPAAGGR